MPFIEVGTFYCARLGWFLAVITRRGFYSHGLELEAVLRLNYKMARKTIKVESIGRN
jgi:hypothetical protein